MNRFLIVPLAIVVAAFSLLVGCGRSQGKKTFEFLKAEREILNNTNSTIKQHPKPKQPTPPDLSNDWTRSERADDIKAYRVAMAQYFGAAIQYSQQVEKLANEAQTKISRLDSSGIGADAVDLTKDYEQELGSRVQECVEVEAILKLAQAELKENRQAELASHLLKGALVLAADYCTAGALTPALAAGAGTVFKGVVSDENRADQRNDELQSHVANLQKVVAEFDHYRGEVVTKRSELVTAYRAKYPQYDWSSVLPSEEQAAGQTHN
jgi:MFS superfamily sulfate permease-like transporter